MSAEAECKHVRGIAQNKWKTLGGDQRMAVAASPTRTILVFIGIRPANQMLRDADPVLPPSAPTQERVERLGLKALPSISG
jgi:hypothetical protein